jgi:hypothetical protein
MSRPALLAAASVLVHLPGLVPLGSRTARQIAREPELLDRIRANMRSFDDAVGYAPNQVFIGAMPPAAMGVRPYFVRRVEDAQRLVETGAIVTEDEFLPLMAVADQFKRLALEEDAYQRGLEALKGHPLGHSFAAALQEIKPSRHSSAESDALALRFADGRMAGALLRGHPEDANLEASVLAENLACKASGALALSHLLERHCIAPSEIDYVIGCSEEAVGDRYQRGGGNIGKAIAEMTGCTEASGADVKNFCAAPVPAMVIAASLVAAGVFRRVAVVGGGSLPKLGMKFEGHLKHGMPILEDMLGAVAVIIGEDDGESPLIRLDSVGRHRVRAASSAEALMEELIVAPLSRLGLSMADVDQYVTELHNPELTEPQGGGDVPGRNYRIIAAMAARRGVIAREEIPDFIANRGIPGFAPTQGHIASAFCYMTHARQALLEKSNVKRIMVLAKGSLFLGMMTAQSDGMSFLLERNGG